MKQPATQRQLAVLLVIALTACSAGDAGITAPGAPLAVHATTTRLPAIPPATQVLRRQLERAADGLLYTSESDYPFTWFLARGRHHAPLHMADVLNATDSPPDTPVEVIPLDRFFARHIELVDPSDRAAVALVPRYRHLRELLRHDIPDIQVFRVGSIEIHCYLVGTDHVGDIVGLSTIAIET